MGALTTREVDRILSRFPRQYDIEPVSGPDLDSIYDEHADAVFRFAYRMTGETAQAEDVVQDCFLALSRGAAAYDPARGTMRAFLLGVARRILLRRWREQSRFEALEDGDAAVETLDIDGLEIADAVAAGVQALPPLQREALVLAEYEGMTMNEIAQAAGASVGVVKARLHRARENLRKSLARLAAAHGVRPR
jgi:RNA polymerase sigma-70 factor (ECF subfamily)